MCDRWCHRVKLLDKPWKDMTSSQNLKCRVNFWQGEWISIQRGYCSLWTNGYAAKRMSYGHLGIRVKWSCTYLYSARYLISKVLYYIMWCYLIIQISPKKNPMKARQHLQLLPAPTFKLLANRPTSRLLARASKVCGITWPLKMIKSLQPSDNIYIYIISWIYTPFMWYINYKLRLQSHDPTVDSKPMISHPISHPHSTCTSKIAPHWPHCPGVSLPFPVPRSTPPRSSSLPPALPGSTPPAAPWKSVDPALRSTERRSPRLKGLEAGKIFRIMLGEGVENIDSYLYTNIYIYIYIYVLCICVCIYEAYNAYNYIEITLHSIH